MKRAHVIGAALVIAFGAFGLGQLKNTLRTYVGFSEAKSGSQRVQIKGKIDRKSVQLDSNTGRLSFDVTDDAGERMRINYGGATPGNFNQASHVVAVGEYRDGAFQATDLLIKCPSKYEGQTKPAGP